MGKNAISNLAQKADLFSSPIYLNVKGREKMASTLGGLLSIALILILLAQGIIQTITMFEHTQPAILQMNEFQDPPALIGLNDTNNFVFAVSTTVDGNIVDMTNISLFTFEAAFTQYFRHDDRPRDKVKSKVTFAPCQPNNFSEKVFPSKTFSAYQLQFAYCPIEIDFRFPNGTCPEQIIGKFPSCISPPHFNISGTYLSKDFEFIQFNISICNQTDSDIPAGLKCDTLENITSVLSTAEVKWNLYFSNNLLNPVIYDNPNKTYLDSMYWDINSQFFKIADIFLDQETVKSFDSYYSGSDYKNATYYSVDQSKNREQQMANTNFAYPVLQWNLRRSTFNLLTVRTYTKIQDVLANIGGFSKSIMVVFAIIATGYVKYKYQMTLSNEVYDYEAVEKNKPHSYALNNRSNDPEDGSGSTIKKRNPSLSMQENLMSPNAAHDPQHYVNDLDDEKTRDFFEKDRIAQRRLGYSEVKYFANLLCCCRKKRTDDKIAQKGREFIEEDIDIIHIIRKIKEVDKLKMVLMTKDQRDIFDHIPKPLVTEHHAQPVERDASYIHADQEAVAPFVPTGKYNREDEERLMRYANLYLSYRRLMKEKERNRTTCNDRLFTLLGPDMIEVFQKIDRELGENFDRYRLEDILWRYIQNEKKNK